MCLSQLFKKFMQGIIILIDGLIPIYRKSVNKTQSEMVRFEKMFLSIGFYFFPVNI